MLVYGPVNFEHIKCCKMCAFFSGLLLSDFKFYIISQINIVCYYTQFKNPNINTAIICVIKYYT